MGGVTADYASGMTSFGARAAAWIIALVVGAVYGVACTIAHAFTYGPIPVGLVLGIVGLAAMIAAVRLLTSDRWAALATGLGATLATVLFSGAGPGGSVVVPGGPLGIAWTIAVPVIAVLVVVWPDAARNGRAGHLTAEN